MIICLKGISEDCFSVNSNVKIINVSLKFFIKVPVIKAKLNLYQNNLKSLLNQRSDSTSVFVHVHRTLFLFSLLFQLHLTRHSGLQSAYKETQRALEYSRHSEGTWAFKKLDTRTYRALMHLGA